MIFKQFCALSLLLGPLCAPVFAKSADDNVLGAFDAYRAGDPMKLAKHAKKAEDHVLMPWVDYWRLALRLDDAQASEVRSFFAAQGNSYVAERLRGDWLKVLGKRADWKEFERELANYAREDLEIRCYAWLSRLSRGDESVLAEAQEMWLEPRELAPSCEKMA